MDDTKTAVTRIDRALDIGRFALRCSISALASYLLAVWLGLSYLVWAPMSALIVSQESLETTRHAVIGRIVGTVLGVLVAVLVVKAGEQMNLSDLWQLSLGVWICAVCAKGRPAMRVSLWTCPLVLLTQTPSISTEMTALFRGSEVIVGAVVGGLVHLAEEWLVMGTVFLVGGKGRGAGKSHLKSSRSWWTRDSEE